MSSDNLLSVLGKTKESFLSDKSITSLIVLKATERNASRSKSHYRKYLSNLHKNVSNAILDTLVSVNGLPRRAFLNRMLAVTPYVSVGKINIRQLIEDLVDMIGENQEIENFSKKAVLISERGIGLRKLCQISASKKYTRQMQDWITDNPGSIQKSIINCLQFEHEELAIEACLAASYLARQYHFVMYIGTDLLIANLIRMLAIAMIPLENYVHEFRIAKDRHRDLELFRSRNISFHFYRMKVEFNDCHHRLVGFIYYTLADLIHSIPCPKLIHFFECRIFHRKEMTRTILFEILNSIIVNLSELQTESDRLVHSSLIPIESIFGIGSKRFTLKACHWQELPARLYIELLRVCNDSNIHNSIKIHEIMALLKTQAPIKLPIFDDDALKALELYTHGTNGDTVLLNRAQMRSKSRSTMKIESPNIKIKSNSVASPRISSEMGKQTQGNEQAEPLEEDEFEDDYTSIESDARIADVIRRKSSVIAKVPNIFSLSNAKGITEA